MTWLGEPQDEAERLVREGLDRAKQRVGDEVTHRRVWAKVAEASTMPERVSGRRWIWVSAAATAAAAVGLFAYVRYYQAPGASVDIVSVAAGPATTESEKSEDPGPAASASSGSAQERQENQLAPQESERGPGNVIRTRQGERVHVSLGGGAVAELDENSAMTWDAQHRPTIQRGIARLAVPHQPPGWRFSVTAGPYVVTVVGTKFDVRVSSRTVGVEVTEGVVEVWRNSRATRLAAGDSWQGPLHPDEPGASASSPSVPSSPSTTSSSPPAAWSPAERPQPVAAPTAVLATAPAPKQPASVGGRSSPEAETALRTGDPAKAIDLLSKTAQGTGAAAENAAYEMARIARYQLHRPRQAVALWDRYRTRFPTGLLRTEADLSIVETLAQLGEVRAALAEADAFLARHPQSERRRDVQRLAERLRAAQAIYDVK